MVARDASPGPGWATLREPTASTAPSETEEDYQAIQHTTSTKKRKPPQGPSPQRKPKFPRLANANESIDPTPKKGTARKSAATARAASRSGSGSARLRDNGDLSRSPPPRRSQPSSGAGPPQIAQSITEAYSSRPSGSTSALPSRPRSSNSSSTDDNTRTRTFVKDSGPSSSARPTTPPLSRRGFGATNPLNRRNTSMGIPFRRQRTPESSRDSTSSPDLPDTLSQSLTQGQSRNPPKRHGKEAQSTRVIAMSGSRAHEKRRATISHRETPVSPAKSDQTMTPIHNRNRARNNVSKDRRKTMQTISISSDERASPDPLPNTQRRLSRGPVLQGTGKVDDPLTIIDDDDDDDIPASTQNPSSSSRTRSHIVRKVIDLDDSDEEGTPPSVSLFPNRVQSQPVREQSHVDDDDDPFASNPPLDVPQVYSPDNTHEDWMQDTEQDASFNPDSTADPGAMDIAVSPHVTTEHIAPDAIELASPNILNADQLFAVQATESSQEHGNHPSESLVMPIDVHSVASPVNVPMELEPTVPDIQRSEQLSTVDSPQQPSIDEASAPRKPGRARRLKNWELSYGGAGGFFGRSFITGAHNSAAYRRTNDERPGGRDLPSSPADMEQSAVSVTNLSDQLPFHAASDGGGTPSDGAQPHLTSAVPNADTRDNSEGTLTHLSPARSIQHVGVDGVEIQPCEPHSDISPSPSNGVPVEHDFLSDDPQVVEHEVRSDTANASVPTGDPVELDQSVPENKRTSTLLEVLRDAETRVEPNSTSSLTTTVSNTVIIDLTLDSDEEEEEALRSAMRLEALLPQVSPSQKREAFDSSLESLSRQPLGSASAHTPDGTPELCATGKSKEPSIVKNHRSSSMQELLNIRKKLTNPSALATQPNDLPSEPLRHSIPSAPVAQLPIDNAVPLSTATSALPAMASATDLKAGLPECPPVVPQVYREEVCTNVTSRHFNSQSSTPAIPVGPTAQFEPLERDEPMQIEDPGRSHREMVAAAPVTLETFPQDGEDEDVDDSYEIQPLGRRRHVARQRESSDSNDELWELMYPESTDAEMSDEQVQGLLNTQRDSAPSQSYSASVDRVTRRNPRRSTRSGTSSSDPMDLFDDSFSDPMPSAIARPSGRRGVSDELVSGLRDIHLGGQMTWIDYRDLMREYAPDVKLAKDLPHQIQDRMNALPPLFRRSDMARALLEAAISANTAEDEPTAPPISIINNIDDDVVPPWEFHYSNKLWHGDGVPLPNPLNLVSCDCEGPCNPKSKTCACVRRQAKYIDKETRIDGFMYDAYGRLKESGQPIFECNEFCGCSDDCTNRVVQHGRKCEIHIVKTKDKGWGVFAGNKKIPAGTFLGIYSGEILTEREGEERGIKYNKFGRTYLFDIDFGHLQSEDKDWSNTYVMDAYHAGNFTRFLNHSCDPNCWINACYINEDNIQKPLLTIFTFRDVEPKEELCFSYYGEQDDENGDPGSPDAPGSDAVYRPCMCGTARCTGRMWKT